VHGVASPNRVEPRVRSDHYGQAQRSHFVSTAGRKWGKWRMRDAAAYNGNERQLMATEIAEDELISPESGLQPRQEALILRLTHPPFPSRKEAFAALGIPVDTANAWFTRPQCAHAFSSGRCARCSRERAIRGRMHGLSIRRTKRRA
jgi:hypothetical protein